MAADAKQKWIRVTAQEPCPACQHSSWCTRSADGAVVRCMRVESETKSEGADGSVGWIHRLTDPLPKVEKCEKPKPTIDWEDLARRYYANGLSARRELAVELGVSAESLTALRMGVGYDYNGAFFFSFPSRNHKGEIVGIQRRYPSGKKKTMRYATLRLFYERGWSQHEGPVYIPEGPTDVAALITAGYSALGRPSRLGGVKELAAMIRARAKGRAIVVLAEHDKKQIEDCKCGHCGRCWPGLHGAKRTADELSRRVDNEVTWILPPPEFKDVREWLSNESDLEKTT